MAKKKKEEPMFTPAVDIDMDEGMSSDEALAKAVITLAKSDKIKILTELSDNEIKLCSALYVVGTKMNDEMLLQFLTEFLNLRVSKTRKGRLEILKIAQSSAERQDSRLSKFKSIFMGNRGI